MKRTTSLELAADIAAETGLYLRDVIRVLRTLDDVVRKEVLNGEIVEVTGLGTLRLVKRPATRKFIPGKGTVKQINARYDVAFNPSVAFKLSYPEVPEVPEGNPGDEPPFLVELTEKP